MKSLSNILTGALVVALGVTLFLVNVHPVKTRYAINDFFKNWGYEIPADIEELADNITLTEKSRYTLAATHPEIRDKAAFNEVCPASSESSVLGCYTNDRIFVLDVTDEELAGVEQVTAAHEVLHAEWARLEEGDKQTLSEQLQAVYKDNSDNQRLVDLVNNYEQSDDGSDPWLIPNELHSILPTELETLSPELEEYYQQFFNDRSKVVQYFKAYEDEFSSRRARIDQIQAELQRLGRQIETLNIEIDELNQRNQTLINEINSLRDSEQVEASNRLVPEQNRVVAILRLKVDEVNNLVVRYNELVEENNNLAVELNDLASSLDATQVEL